MSRLSNFFGTGGYQRTNQKSHDNESLLNESKASEADFEEAGDIAALETQSRPMRPWLKYLLVVPGLALYSFLLVTYVPQNISDLECAKQTSLWSPLNEAIEYDEYDLNNQFDHDSKYRGPPTPELEKNWNELWKFDPVAFPEDKLHLVNRSNGILGDDKLARLDAGNGEVAANFEIFHSLHCLNYLRQYTWRDWYFRHPNKVVIPMDMLASDVGVRMHADHCIEFLRTTLMCHGDTTPFFTVVDPEEPMGARGDFSAHHKCRNFEKLQEWTRQNSHPFEEFGSHHK